MKEFYYTYILLCNDDSFYTGVTNNIIRRVNEHNSDDEPRSYCHTRRPVHLMFIRVFQLIDDAIAFEKQLKNWSRAKKEALIFNQLEKLHNLAECKNHSNSKYYNKFPK